MHYSILNYELNVGYLCANELFTGREYIEIVWH